VTSNSDLTRTLLGDRDEKALLGVPGSTERISELYRMYVELMDRTTGRRQTANSFFVSLNAALLTLGSLTNVQGVRIDQRSGALASAFGGVIASILWWRLVRSYGALNGARFRVIGELERLLPVRPFAAEWAALNADGGARRFVAFSTLEQIVPFLFVAVHAVAALLRI
jgi:hypothetical protein